jgi:hypothetical protein
MWPVVNFTPTAADVKVSVSTLLMLTTLVCSGMESLHFLSDRHTILWNLYMSSVLRRNVLSVSSEWLSAVVFALGCLQLNRNVLN